MENQAKRYWFRRKQYGWGWTPATWEGWVTIVIFLAVFMLMYVPFIFHHDSNKTDLWWFLAKMLVWGVALIGVCYYKGESPRWEWGRRDDSMK